MMDSLRVLIADDHPLFRNGMRTLLSSVPTFEVVGIATNGDEVISLAASMLPDVILMDLQMPVMDGLEATRQIRSHSHFTKLPILAMTAHALAEERERCLEAGMNDHISKPIDPDALLETLLRWVKPHPERVTAHRPNGRKAEIDVPLPTIAGVDLDDGLRRVAGNKQLYLELLEQFAAKQADSAAQISAALADGDRILAERIAHTTKGVAGNLGMGEIQNAAQRLESAIRDESPVPAILGEFSRLLSHVVHEIKQALNGSPVHLPGVNSAAGFDAQSASAAILQLRFLLENSDGNAEEAFRGMRSAVASVVDKADLDALGGLIKDFDFEAALKKLEQLSQLWAGGGAQAK